MSRSYKKTPIFGVTTARSNKKSKKLFNRKVRRTPQDKRPNYKKTAGYGFAKDGWWYKHNATKKDMRK